MSEGIPVNETAQRVVTLPNGRAVLPDENNYVEIQIVVDLSELIDNDLEQFLDLIAERATGSVCLQDVNYGIVSYEGSDTLLMRVTGDISDMIES